MNDPNIAKPLNVVAIGGGSGLSTLLTGLKEFVRRDPGLGHSIRSLSAIVAVSDDGGSSGRLRDEFRMPPPGDIRNCMVALSEDSRLLSKLFRHRFSGGGDLGGHNFGNLFLAALSEITGDFAEAVRLSSEVLASKGHIHPATDSDVRIVAELEDGTVIRGETNVGKAGRRIKRLRLEPEKCHPMPGAVEAIEAADIITVGPGSMYTSLLPPLLVDGLAKKIADTNATKIFICNLMTQPGETDGMTARRHLEVVKEHVPELTFDVIIVNDRLISQEQAAKYELEGSEQIGVHGSITGDTIDGAKIFYADLLDAGEKVRHDPAKLAAAVLNCSSRVQD
ncbi:MAG: uridine diphosphate-N-acetylglucosamine-binding protein YvcK [Pyrinomonadaceae bacterium]|nr:uridine diphosphate-N-acetylglucosamine-binding protein YvcK [Pyrinomonadaceae bacterium]